MLLGHQTWTSELSTHILHEFFSTEKKGTEILYEKPISLVFFFHFSCQFVLLCSKIILNLFSRLL